MNFAPIPAPGSSPPRWSEILESVLAEGCESVLPPKVELPVLPKALQEFKSKAEDPNAEMDDLARIVSSDAGLSTELLRSVNCSKFTLTSKVTSVKQALVLLGVKNSMLHLINSSVKQMMRSTSSKLINIQNFWNANLERSLFARELATLLGVDADLAFTAGMLQDFLLPLITNQLLDTYLEFTENRGDYENLVQFEREKFGWDHAQAAAHVMHAWQFPEELVCCVCFHHAGLDILNDARLSCSSAAAVAISSLIPDAIRQEADGMDKLIRLESAWDQLNLLELAEKIDQEMQQMSGKGGSHISLLRLCRAAKR